MPQQLVLFIHIGAGSVALLSGTTALSYRKGSRVHRGAGNVFFSSMLVMSVLGAWLALAKPDFGTAMMGMLTFYLVATAWLTAVRTEGESGRAEIAAMLAGWSMAAGALVLGLVAMIRDDGVPGAYPAGFFFGFAAIATALALGDGRVVARRGIAGAKRLLRHLGRMGTAFLIAVLSFFIGQQDEFPDAIRGSPAVYLPVLLVLVTTVYWAMPLFGQKIAFLLLMPLALSHLALALWLIVKGLAAQPPAASGARA